MVGAAEALISWSSRRAQRGISLCQSLLRAQLGQRVNVMILEKALTLELTHFEDSEFYDKLTRARREASSRPLSLVMRTFGPGPERDLARQLRRAARAFSPWAVVVLCFGGLPAFVAETKFSGDAFRLFRWRAPETRMQIYLETVLAREDHAKEVKLFGLGPLFLDRYQAIFDKLYARTARSRSAATPGASRSAWSSIAAFYGAYAWIALAAVRGLITLGEMTMYVVLFRQGQSAVSASLGAIGGMYEDNLYLSNLYEYLEQPVDDDAAAPPSAAPIPATACASRTSRSRYPGATRPRSPASTCTSRPARASRSSARTAPARPR